MYLTHSCSRASSETRATCALYMGTHGISAPRCSLGSPWLGHLLLYQVVGSLHPAGVVGLSVAVGGCQSLMSGGVPLSVAAQMQWHSTTAGLAAQTGHAPELSGAAQYTVCT